MLPEFNIKNVKLKISADNISLSFTLISLVAFGSYIIISHSYQRSGPWGFLLGFLLIAGQTLLLKLPWTRNKEFVNSGGVTPLIVYNLALMIAFIWYVPLYSPFLLSIPATLFTTVYYRGYTTAVVSILGLIFLVVVATVKNGLPPLPYAEYYPYLIVFLTIAYVGVVSRAGHIENGIRLELSKAGTHISNERQQLGTLINSITDAVIATDASGNILFYNTAAQQLFDTKTIHLGQPFAELVKLFDGANQPADILRPLAAKTGPAKFSNLHILQANNEKTDLGIDVSPIVGEVSATEKSGFIILMRDITKEKTFDEERTEFISVTSHELRTPITVAEANMSLAMNSKAELDPAVRDKLEKAHTSILLLADLTNRLITISEAENSRLESSAQSVDIGGLLGELNEKYRRLAADKGLGFSVHVAEGLPALTTSKVYLSEIVDNFLSNAVAYTTSGSVALDARLSEDKSGMIISVKDTGKGISLSDKPQVFKKFFRAEDFHTRETQGTGLGLYVSLRLAEYLGAQIWFDSELGQGSTFYIRLKTTTAAA